MFDFSDSHPPPLLFSTHICLSDDFCLAPTFVFPTTLDLLTHLSFRLLLIRSHICFSDDFCFAPFICRDFVPSGLLHSFSTNLRLRLFNTLVPHNLVYPELFFVPMSISTVAQISIQSTILQLVTHIITQTERCSSPCFFMGVSIIGY